MHDAISLVSETFPRNMLERILKIPGVFEEEGHFLYPADSEGSHLLRFFTIEPIVENQLFIQWIVEDIVRWVEREKIEFGVVFAPNQPGVTDIAEEIAWVLDARTAFWEWHETGRFGDQLDSGRITPGERVLLFNGITQQGRCVGSRLPEFVRELGGVVVAAAVFAKGTSGLVKECEAIYGSKFYSAIQVDIPVYSPGECPLCMAGDKESLRPWTILRKQESRKVGK